jgi:hypothetical protein
MTKKQIVESLREGAEADIWYDTHFELEEEDEERISNQIQRIQQAMLEAAETLEAIDRIEDPLS